MHSDEIDHYYRQKGSFTRPPEALAALARARGVPTLEAGEPLERVRALVRAHGPRTGEQYLQSLELFGNSKYVVSYLVKISLREKV